MSGYNGGEADADKLALTTPSLSTIIALARAGALDHAWAQFCAAGYDRVDDDPAALTVKGRLLKDQALRAEGEERRRLYLKSAEAYLRAAKLRPATYPLINAATLSLLSGDHDQARKIARKVLGRIAREPEEPETPYWRAATEAEALRLLGRTDEARAALDAAVAAAPDAWEDHASTLRQFLVIETALGGDAAWLQCLRPRRSLHYAGAPGGEAVAGDPGALASFIRDEKVGFAFGGLAAGAEILAAEAAVEAGAELHVVLASDAASFASTLVDPAGADWHARFDTLLERAASVTNVRPLRVAPDGAHRALAAEIAAGMARLNAQRLLGEAVGVSVGQDGRAERAVPGAAAVGLDPAAAATSNPGLQPLALLALGVGGGDEPEFEQRLERVRAVLGSGGGARVAPHLAGDGVLIGFESAREAADVARRLHARLSPGIPLRIAAHYGLLPCVRDPFAGTLRPTESGTTLVLEIAGAMPPDTICASEEFAAILAARSQGGPEASWIGELAAFDGGSAIRLYALDRGS